MFLKATKNQSTSFQKGEHTVDILKTMVVANRIIGSPKVPFTGIRTWDSLGLGLGIDKIEHGTNKKKRNKKNETKNYTTRR